MCKALSTCPLFLGTGAGMADDSSEREFRLVGKTFERGGASKGDFFELVEATVDDWFDKSPDFAGDPELGLATRLRWVVDFWRGRKLWSCLGKLQQAIDLRGVERPVNPHDTLISHPTGPEVAQNSPEIT